MTGSKKTLLPPISLADIVILIVILKECKKETAVCLLETESTQLSTVSKLI